MLPERVTIDPVTEDSTLVPLDLMGTDRSWGIYVMAHDYTPPELQTQTAGSADTDGDPVVQSRYGNRTITARVRIFEPTDPAGTNLATNPIAALANTTWAGVSLAAGPTRVTPATVPTGKGIDTAIEAQTNAAGDYVYHDTINVTNGKTYRASVYVQLSALTATGVRIVVYNAAGAAKKAEGATYKTVDVTANGWTRLDVAFTADATAAWRVGVEQVGAGGATFLTTGVLVEEGGASALPPYAPAVLTDAPLLYWRVGEAAGPEAADSSGNARNGTAAAGVTFAESSLLTCDTGNAAVKLSGTATGRITSTYAPFAAGSTRTFEGWAIGGKGGSEDVLIASDGNDTAEHHHVALAVEGTSAVRFYSRIDKAFVEWAGAWPGIEKIVHWVLVYNDATKKATLWINGVSQGEKELAEKYDTTPGNFQAGVRSSAFANPFHGKMDEIAIYNGALSEARVKAHYEAGISAPPAAAEPALLTPFYCGDTPGCDWGGARHGSTSSRPAPDGTRFTRIYRDVTRKLDRIARLKSGTCRRIAPGFKPITFDLRSAKITEAPQDLNLGMKRAEIALAFEADPGGRTAEVQIGGTREETALPYLAFLAEEVPGELDALGRLVIEDKQAQNQLAVWWAEQHDNYSSAATADVFYQAEGRTLFGKAALQEWTGASGAGNNAVRLTGIPNVYQALFSTQATGGGAHLSHVGTYRILARVSRLFHATNSETKLKLQWSEGDFTTTNTNDEDEVTLTDSDIVGNGKWMMVDLGLVTLSRAPAGSTQRWEARVLTKASNSFNDIVVDYLMVLPADEPSGQIIVPANPPAASSYSLQDGYDGGEGSLTGKALPIGAGTYSLAGDAVGFTYGVSFAQRSEKSDAAGVGAYAIGGTTEMTDVLMTVWAGGSNAEVFGRTGAFLRYTDVNNHVKLVMVRGSVGVYEVGYGVVLIKKKAGVETVLGSIDIGDYSRFGAAPEGLLMAWITAGGAWRLGWNNVFEVTGEDADLAGAGTLKTGKLGIYDELTLAETSTRFVNEVAAYAPSPNAAIFASRQLEVRNDQVRRQDSAGVTWGKIPFEGKYLMVPPAGPEKLPTRFVVKASRDPANDAGIDDIAAKLFAQPRYLIAPPA